MHYELRELHRGRAVDGVRYTSKNHTWCGMNLRGLPDGDTIAFAGSTPLPARKDMVLMAAYHARFQGGRLAGRGLRPVPLSIAARHRLVIGQR